MVLAGENFATIKPATSATTAATLNPNQRGEQIREDKQKTPEVASNPQRRQSRPQRAHQCRAGEGDASCQQIDRSGGSNGARDGDERGVP